MPVEKRIIFTVTSGRSGSDYLAQLLSSVPGVHAEHEPEPNFVLAMRRVQNNPAVASAFLTELKFPAINKIAEPVFAETSHLTCKGFLEPMFLMGLRPGLIFLRRPPREVALSYFERNTIPGRTTWGCAYLLDPRDPFVLPLIGWETMHDYQLCFWYALEMEHRYLRYATQASELGLPTVDVTNLELSDWTAFSRLLSTLSLPNTEANREAHTRISEQHHNPNPPLRPRMSHDEVAPMEEQVWNHVANFEPLLRQKVHRRYALSP